MSRTIHWLLVIGFLIGSSLGRVETGSVLAADEPKKTSFPLWGDAVPEPRITVDAEETILPERPGPAPITRVTNIKSPYLVHYPVASDKVRGTAVVVVPGGGYRYLTRDLEGSEACEWLAAQGITAFLLMHRAPTHEHIEPNLAVAQDTQRAVQVVRTRAAEWNLKADRIGVLGFSAGGQAALKAATNAPLWKDAVAATEADIRPDFLLLVYPWGLYDAKTKALRPDLAISAKTPPTFIAQAGDDKASLPQGSALAYLKLLESGVPAELHIYETGGHGFGLRPSKSPSTTNWPLRADDWLRTRGF
jgi:acetyl esterase/lipase